MNIIDGLDVSFVMPRITWMTYLRVCFDQLPKHTKAFAQNLSNSKEHHEHSTIINLSRDNPYGSTISYS